MPTTTAKPIKVYLGVEVDFGSDGVMLPRTIIWEDGSRFEVDRVLDIRPAAAQKAGGQGDKYTFEINGQIRHIFFEHNCDYGSANLGRWFMEWKDETHGAA